MKNEKIIKSVLKEIENLDNSIITYATIVNDGKWLQISVSDFEFYMNNLDFRKLTDKWHKVFNKLGVNLIFVCGWVPTEEKLLELANNNNLILNI